MTRGASEIHEDTLLSSCGPATAIKKKKKTLWVFGSLAWSLMNRWDTAGTSCKQKKLGRLVLVQAGPWMSR